MIGLTGFKLNRIRAGAGAPSSETDNIVFFMNEREWPRRLYDQFTSPDPNVSFDQPLALNYNIGFLFASGPFRLEAGRRERFSLALAYGQDLIELESTVEVVQSIYNANYQFATPPPLPTLQAYAGDGFVTLSWDNKAERGVDPVTNRNDFEGYRIYRSTDPNFLDPQVITNARGTGPLGIGKPLAQFDLENEITGFSDLTVQGTAYWLGEDNGITHTFTDSTVNNGQTYYYAVTSYDRGSEEFKFFPSENPITVSRTPRGGTVLPSNTVEVRPNAPVPGFIPADIDMDSFTHETGVGWGTIEARIINTALVPDGHTFQLDFEGATDSIRAASYSLTDLTTGEVFFEGGVDLGGSGTGPIAQGVLPIVWTPETVLVDTLSTGFEGGGTNAVYSARYSSTVPINQRRPGFPEDLMITFSDVPLDTSVAAIGAPAVPANFRIDGLDSGTQFDFRFRDVNADAVLSAQGEFIEVLMFESLQSTVKRPVWRVEFDEERSADPPGLIVPTNGDVYNLILLQPFGNADAFTFRVRGQSIDEAREEEEFENNDPYVVPNPYVASAEFEPERFAVSGRGVRRLEFRGIPADASIRIYTIRGVLVEVLHHDGSTAGVVPWNLRSRDNLEVAPGLYIYHVDTRGKNDFVGKFAIIK
jgi:hypothetical protein